MNMDVLIVPNIIKRTNLKGRLFKKMEIKFGCNIEDWIFGCHEIKSLKQVLDDIKESKWNLEYEKDIPLNTLGIVEQTGNYEIEFISVGFNGKVLTL